MGTLLGLQIIPREALVGSKLAVRIGGDLFVSPAMMSLMRNSTPEELQRLLMAIRVLDLGESTTFLGFSSQPISVEW